MAPGIKIGRFVRLLEASHPAELLCVSDRFLREEIHSENVEILLASYDGTVLRRLEPDGAVFTEALQVVEGKDGAVGAFRSGRPVVQSGAGPERLVFTPLTLHGERLGVLQVGLPTPPGSDLLDDLSAVAAVIAHMVIWASRLTDVFERVRRLRPFSLPAEMQWVLLPARGYSCEQFSIAGQLVPAHRVGGDHFDFHLEPASLLLTLSDAMGHGLDAAMVTALGVGALRHARRHQLDIEEQLQEANQALCERFSGEQFATGLIFQVDLDTGLASVVNAGYPALLRVRGGEVVVLSYEPHLPLGMFEDTVYASQRSQLLAGDRLLFVSDGAVEAVDSSGESFGDHLLTNVLRQTAAVTAHEVVATLQARLLDHQDGHPRDDATIVCLDWRGGTRI